MTPMQDPKVVRDEEVTRLHAKAMLEPLTLQDTGETVIRGCTDRQSIVRAAEVADGTIVEGDPTQGTISGGFEEGQRLLMIDLRVLVTEDDRPAGQFDRGERLFRGEGRGRGHAVDDEGLTTGTGRFEAVLQNVSGKRVAIRFVGMRCVPGSPPVAF